MGQWVRLYMNREMATCAARYRRPTADSGESVWATWGDQTTDQEVELCPKVGDGDIRRRVWLA